jgi:hypothetical protein
VLDVRNEPGNEDEIQSGVTDDLIGDAVIAALGVSRRRSHSLPLGD